MLLSSAFFVLIEVSLSCVLAEQGYDPFKPEVVRPQVQQNGEPAASGDLSGALELVNRAIEEVRSEVEREKRKLSRIGDEPYEPSESISLSSSDNVKRKAPPSHMAYDPGSYQMASQEYNPTPGCSKYTLDSDKPGNNSNSMEYVPTSVKKPSCRTHSHQIPSPPPSPKYSNSTSSSKCKYTVDNSRPTTDMEYDPLSNYSAGITVKSKRDKGAQVLKMEGSKTCKLPGLETSDEECVVVQTKPQQQSVDSKKYTFSDSDGESSGTEYRPTSLSNVQQRKGNSGTLLDAMGNERKRRVESMFNALTQRNKEDLAVDSDTQEGLKQRDSLEKKKVASRGSQEKSCKSEKLHKHEKEVNKTAGNKSSGSSSKDKGSAKNSNQDSAKKENKSHGKSDDRKSRDKVKTSGKVQREGKDKKRSDSKIRAGETVKTDRQDRNMENGASESKKVKMSDKEKEVNKNKDRHHKNGKFDSSKREKEIKKSSSSSKSSSSNSKGSSALSKDKLKQKFSPSNGKKLEEKRRSVSLSHAELFGDESPEEAEPIEVDDDDDDDEPEEMLVRKSANALKRVRLKKRKASELTPSSSDDEGDCVMVGSMAGKYEVPNVGMDFSNFQDELDLDSDPMEECLRIFNESKVVKKEDKGRQAKQVIFMFATVFVRVTFCSSQWMCLNKCTIFCPFSPRGIRRRREAQRAL